jgi:hypothetical protein
MIRTWGVTALTSAPFVAALSRSRSRRVYPSRWGRGAAVGAALILVLTVIAAVAVYVVSRGREPGGKLLPVEKHVEHSGFSRIEFRSVVYKNGQVWVEGSTDLPDGALVSVDFNIAGPPDSEADDAVSVNTEVRGGVFTARIEPPHTPAFARGPYVVDVLFSPRAQNGEALRHVGVNGEHLEGEHVRETFGFRVLEVSKRVELKLQL